MKKTTVRASLAALIVLLALCLLAACSEPTYTVTFVLADGRDNVVVDVTPTSELYVPESTEESLVFGGWFTDRECTHPFLGRLSGDTTLYARFIEKGNFVVTFIYGNGSGDTTLVMQGVLNEPTAPVRDGYAFMGWEDASTGLKYEFGTEPQDAHTVLVATWRAAVGGLNFTAYPENGADPEVYNVAYNALPKKPDTPKRDGYEFLGWYADKECTSPYDFTKPVVRDTAVYAGWTRDIASLGNEIAERVLLSAVKVNSLHRSSEAGVTGGFTSVGSGVIYNYRSGYYYVLTNQHVVEDDSEYPLTEHLIYDAYGNEYNATLASLPDAAYDLAVLKFPKGSRELNVASLSEWDVAVGSKVVSVGNPGGVMNTVTYGECKYHKEANVTGSQVKFSIGWHDTPVSNGSSGGAVFNLALEVVGINFASNTDNDGSFNYGVFIPISRVREYLAANEAF